MPLTVSLRSAGTLALAVLTSALCGSCGAGGGSGASQASAKATPPSPRTITDALGAKVTVPGSPVRVLPLGAPTLDATLALGFKPIGTSAGRRWNDIPSYLRRRATTIPNVGDLGRRSLAKVAGLAPDVILLDGTAVQNSAVVERLRRIAPTVYVSRSGENWKTALQATADALGRSGDGADLLAQYDQHVNEAKLAIEEHTTDTVSVVRWDGIGRPVVSASGLCSSRVLADLGLRRPKLQERIDGDWMFFGTGGGRRPPAVSVDTPTDVEAARAAISSAEKIAGFAQIKAVEAGRVVPVDGSAWTGVGGPIAAKMIVDDVARNLGS